MITGMPRIAIAVKDFDAAMATFRDKLGMPVYDQSDKSMEWWGAKVAMCTPTDGSNIEIMAPGDPDEPLSQSVQSFIDRRGEGQFALMLEAARTYGVKFAMPVAAPIADSDRGVRTVICTPPSGGLIELTAVAESSRAYAAGIAEFLAVRGEGMCALVLRCDDLRACAHALADKGIPSIPVPGLAAAVELDRSSMNGARFWLERQPRE